MWYDANRRAPTRSGERSSCGLCHAIVIGRCGQIVARHWAHASALQCDPWWEAETRWHRTWKSLVPADRREVVIGRHRADLVTADGTVVELQHSSIAPAEIREREAFYRRMVWLFDGTTLADRLTFHETDLYLTFRWKHPRKSLAFARRPVYVDLGVDEVLQIRRLCIGGQGEATGGWGHVLPYARFARTVLKCAPADLARVGLHAPGASWTDVDEHHDHGRDSRGDDER
jgi:competence protein CoiA